MVKEERYLKSIKALIEKGIKIEQIERGIMGDYAHEKISIDIYEKAMKVLERIGKSTLITREITDPEEKKKAISMMEGKHKINVLPEESER